MPGSSLNITLPEVGTDSWATWADGINTALTTIINDLEPQIVTSEINENADHDFNGYALTDVRWAQFRAGNTTDLPTYGAGFKDGNFWVCDGSGNQVQVTSGGSLLAGGNGFSGDTAYAYYTASSALYEFKDSGGNYADVKAANFTTSTGAEINGGGNGTAFTLPTAAPAGVALLSIDAAGQVAHNATVAVGFTINNADITLTGTADIVHPDREVTVRAASSMFFESGAGSPSTAALGGGLTSGAGAWVSYYEAPDVVNVVGNRVKSVTVTCDKGDASVTDTQVSYYIRRQAGAAGSAVATGSDSTSGTDRQILATAGAPSAIATGETAVVKVTFASSTNTVYSIKWVYDRT